MAGQDSTDDGDSSNEAFESLERLNRNAEALRKGDARAKEAMIADCFALVANLETPNQTFIRLMWPYVIQPVITRLASDMKVFETLSAAGRPLHTRELAAPTSADLRLTQRILKTLASFQVIKELDVDLWATTAFADVMSSETSKQALEFMIPYSSGILSTAPDYFRANHYQLPSSALDTTVQYAHGVSGQTHFYELLRKEGRMPNFESLMRVLWDRRAHWSAEAAGYYPIHQRLLDGASKDSDAVFLVDVGGGHGQDFSRLFANVPENEIPGRLVLQDLPAVITTIPEDGLPARVEKMEYDFNTPQPVIGARVYFMHSILHNYPDSEARVILQQVAKAMKKGYSKLLLWDNVMSDKAAATNTMCLDFIMVAFFAAGQRTEQEWRTLVDSSEAGLKITDIIRYSPQDQAIIELELV